MHGAKLSPLLRLCRFRQRANVNDEPGPIIATVPIHQISTLMFGCM